MAAKLKYGNEPSLRQRLKSLCGGLEPIYGSAKAIKALISKIVTTRNYLTHYDHELKSDAAQGRALYRLIIAMEILFQLQLLIPV